jgi:hypothetical protein
MIGAGNWKNLYGCWMFWMSVRGKGDVWRVDRLGREPDVEVRRTWAVEEDLVARFVLGRTEDLDEGSVERRFGLVLEGVWEE